MPPEAIKDTSSQTGKARSKVCYFRFYWFDRVTNQTENATVGKTPSANFVQQISPKGDVWSLGCILYCMTYGKTPFQSITNQISKLHAIIDPSHKIEFPDISEKDLLDVLKVKRCHRWDFCVTVLHTLKWESVQSIVDESLLEVLLRSCKIKIFSFCFVCFLFFFPFTRDAWYETPERELPLQNCWSIRICSSNHKHHLNTVHVHQSVTSLCTKKMPG